MRNTLLLAAAIAVASSVYAQKKKDRYDFGQISPEELTMTKYELDTAAKAVVLFDFGGTALGDDLNGRFMRHIRIKFFGNKDITEYSDVRLVYKTDGQRISKVKGATYNMENGKMVTSELKSDGIFKEKIDKRRSALKFTLPNVKPGSVIEYSYTWDMDPGASGLPSWEFQHTIPTIYSDYEVLVGNAFTYRKDMQGFLGLTQLIPKGPNNERMIMRDAPAFKVEPFITTPDDYVSKISYYITSYYYPGRYFDFERNWDKIAKDYDNDDAGGTLVRSNGWLDKTVDPILAGVTNADEKAKRIRDYVQSTIAWNDKVDRYPDHTLRRVLDEKIGSTSEINMLMVAMMRRAELDAYPLLISTRDHGIIRQYNPDEEQFNDVICVVKIDGKNRLFDATSRTLSSNALPERCLNGQGLLVNSTGGEWIPIISSKSRITYTANFKLDPEGELKGNLKITREGLDGGNMRSSIASLGKDKYLAEVFSKKSWDVIKSEFNNLEKITEVPNEAHELIIRDHLLVNGDIIYLNPYVTGTEENKFKSEKREYPVDIPTPFDKFYSATFEIPEGYKAEELPATKVFLLPDNAGKFLYSMTVIGNKINFTSQLQVTKNIITPDRYPFFREFYSQIIAKQAEQIVLKKVQ